MNPFNHALRAFLVGLMFSCLLASPTMASEAADQNELAAYVARPDANFGWREVASGHIGRTEYVEYLLTSQTWRDIPWKHRLYVLRPTTMARDTKQGMLFIHGGRWKPEYETGPSELPREAKVFARLAETSRAPLAVLRQVPFQPLFDRREDALIAYTFDQYLKTGEADWPLLLPMVKSASRAMDAVQQIARQRWGVSLESFTVSGASKRGWTTWLIAATDNRVAAAAPMVIDVLNMRAQMDHQRATWGDFSEEIQDYSALGLQSQLDTERGTALLSMVDPFSYRDRLTKPKLILLSTNDRYWPLDALKLYWGALPEPKRVLYVPNQGHGLRDPDRLIAGLSALHRYSAAGKQLPQTTWSFAANDQALTVHVKSDRATERVQLWSARSSTKDFRDSHWSARACKKSSGEYVCAAQRPEAGYFAAFAETTFRDPGNPAFSTTTTVCIVQPTQQDASDCAGDQGSGYSPRK